VVHDAQACHRGGDQRDSGEAVEIEVELEHCGVGLHTANPRHELVVRAHFAEAIPSFDLRDAPPRTGEDLVCDDLQPLRGAARLLVLPGPDELAHGDVGLELGLAEELSETAGRCDDFAVFQDRAPYRRGRFRLRDRVARHLDPEERPRRPVFHLELGNRLAKLGVQVVCGRIQLAIGEAAEGGVRSGTEVRIPKPVRERAQAVLLPRQHPDVSMEHFGLVVATLQDHHLGLGALGIVRQAALP
jgi:hypothetical protein